jgi:hypothetical protein
MPLATGLVTGVWLLAGIGSASAASTWSSLERLYPATPQAITGRVSDMGDLAVDEVGRTAIIYYRDGAFRVRVGTVRKGFGPETDIGRYARSALAFAPDGTLVVALQRHLAAQHIADIVVLQRSPTGVWSAPQSISEPGPAIYAEKPDVAIDGAGDVTVVWQQRGPTYNYQAFAAYRPAAGQFGPPVPLSPLLPAARVLDPRIAASADGTAVVSWTRQLLTGNEVDAVVGRDGVWQPMTVLSPPGDNGFAESGGVAVGPHGEAMISWINSGPQAVAGGRLQAAVRLGCGGFGAPQDLSPVAGQFTGLHAGVDRLGDMLAIWPRQDGGRSLVEAARRPAGAAGWVAPQTIFSWPTSPQLASVAPALAVAPDGQALVAAIGPASTEAVTGAVVRARVGSVRTGRFAAAERVLTSIPGTPGVPDAVAAIGGAVPLVASEAAQDPLDVSYRRAPPVRLTAAQLLATQRTAQAALRRANAVESALDAGLGPQFIRNSGLDASAFGPGVELAQDQTVGCVPPAPPADVPMPTARTAERRVRLSAAQFATTRRVAQAALWRANALKARLDAGLTGGDLRPGAIDQTKLAPGLRLAALTTLGATPGPPTATHLAKSTGLPGRVRLSAGQLAITQHMARAAFERANALVDRLAAGLSTADFRPGSLGPADVSGG